MYDYNSKSKEKQRLKSKKQIQHGVRIGSSLQHLLTGRTGPTLFRKVKNLSFAWLLLYW